MLSVGFTLGLFGSLHCVGMCGALSCTFCSRPDRSRLSVLWDTMSYQIGRVITYIILGVIFGLLSELVVLAELQRWVSIALGILFLGAVLASVDIERMISHVPTMQSYYLMIKSKIAKVYNRSQSQPRILLGILNGFLPCGMVYMALAGSLTSGGVIAGSLFMLAFGLGTLPLMVLFTIGVSRVPQTIRSYFRRAIPYVTAVFGVYLIARGWNAAMPAELDFWHMMKHPVMCFGGE